MSSKRSTTHRSPTSKNIGRCEDGELVNDGKGLFLTTDAYHGDFELLVDYKTVPLADSGIYLRGCPQVQIWDSTEKAQVRTSARTRAPADCGTTRRARPEKIRSSRRTSHSASGTISASSWSAHGSGSGSTTGRPSKARCWKTILTANCPCRHAARSNFKHTAARFHGAMFSSARSAAKRRTAFCAERIPRDSSPSSMARISPDGPGLSIAVA